MNERSLRTPTYDATKDGNVFNWLVKTSKDYRKIRQRAREVTLIQQIDTRLTNDHIRNEPF